MTAVAWDTSNLAVKTNTGGNGEICTTCCCDILYCFGVSGELALEDCFDDVCGVGAKEAPQRFLCKFTGVRNCSTGNLSDVNGKEICITQSGSSRIWWSDEFTVDGVSKVKANIKPVINGFNAVLERNTPGQPLELAEFFLVRYRDGVCDRVANNEYVVGDCSDPDRYGYDGSVEYYMPTIIS